MTQWIEAPNGVKDIPVGDWCVVMKDGEVGYCKARNGANCIVYVINGHFHFDHEPVVAYLKFPM